MSDIFRIACLTPVHVGSGEVLRRGLDFVTSDGRTYFVDHERLAAAAGDLVALADRVVHDKSLAGFLEERRLRPEKFARGSVLGQVQASAIRRALSAGDGRPVIPGSSLKGALRTLLLAGRAGGGDPHDGARPPAIDRAIGRGVEGRGRFRGGGLDEAAFRAPQPPDAKGDVLRALSVSDTAFSPDALCVVSSKALGTNRNTLTGTEAIARGASTVVRLRIDSWLSDKGIGFPFQLPALSELAAWSRKHARHLLRGDHGYFAQAGGDARDMAGVCDALLAQVEQAESASRDAIFLRLGWGTGWRTMTGDLLSGDERARLNMRLLKTRKVILDGHSERSRPKDLYGWVRLDPIDEAAARKLFVPPQVAAPCPLPAGAGAASPAGAQRSPTDVPPQAPAASLRIDPFADRLAALRPTEIGAVAGIASEAAAAHERRAIDSTELDRRLRLLAARVRALWGSDAGKLKRARAIEALAPYLAGDTSRT